MAWQQKDVSPARAKINQAALSAQWEIIPSSDYNAADVSLISNLDHPTYALPTAPSYSSSLLSTPVSAHKRSNGPPSSNGSGSARLLSPQSPASSNRVQYNLAKDLPASPKEEESPLPGSSASPPQLRKATSHNNGFRQTSKFSTDLQQDGEPRRPIATDFAAQPATASRLDSSGGAAGLFGAPQSSIKLKKPSTQWRTRATSLFGASSDSRSSRESRSSRSRPGTALSTSAATTSMDSRQSDQTPRVSSKVLPAMSDQDTPQIGPRSPRRAKLKPAASFDDDAEAFYENVMSSVGREEVPVLLSSSGDKLHKRALQLYMRRFLFEDNPLDVALRKMLMSLSLPKETQQIDRVMESFAQRYNECNPGLFHNADQPYILAFSFMMLHTDTFNRNTRQKMTKADYIRNTSSSEVPADILDYFYDNITFTEFIHVDDDESTFPGRKRRATANATDVGAALRSAVSKTRIDAYYIIATGQTHILRPAITLMTPEKTPFHAKGSLDGYDYDALHSAFVNAPCVEIVSHVRPQSSHAAAGAVSSTFATSSPTAPDDVDEERVASLRVTKVACISRKDDMIDDNRKAPSRRWRLCGMLLSSSQLLFFRDLVWTKSLEQQISQQTKAAQTPDRSIVIEPRITYFKPDGVLALTDAVAVRDESSTKYKHVFRLFAKHGDLSRQYLIQTSSEDDMNDWIHKINYCAAFRSTGIRIRALDPPARGSKTEESLRAVDDPAYLNGSAEQKEEDDKLSKLDPLIRKQLDQRKKEIAPIMEKLARDTTECEKALSEKMHFLRHLAILTPWMKMTRDRIEMLALPVAMHVRALRLAIARYTSHRDLLQLEIDASERAALVAPETMQRNALEFAQASFWSASNTSLNVSSRASSSNENAGESQTSLTPSRLAGLDAEPGGNAFLDIPSVSRFSFSEATGSLFGSGTSTPGEPSDETDGEYEWSDYGQVPMRPMGRLASNTLRSSASSSGSSFARRPSANSARTQSSNGDLGDGSFVAPPIDEGGLAATIRSPEPGMHQNATSPLLSAAMSATSSHASTASQRTAGHTPSNSSLYKRYSSTAAAEMSLGGKQAPAAREEAEAWNRSRVGGGDSKRVSLVRLPEQSSMMDWRQLAQLSSQRRGSLLSEHSSATPYNTAPASSVDHSDGARGAPSIDADLTSLAMDRLRLHSALASSSGQQ